MAITFSNVALFAVVYYLAMKLLALYKKRHLKEPHGNLQGKVAIITGASDGIGVPTAKGIARYGAHTILAVRDEAKGMKVANEIIKETGNKKVEVMQLDLASLESVRNFAAAFKKRNLPLHLLINNAGVVLMGKFETTPDGFEKQLQVNYLSHFLLTMLLLDTIKASGAARIINVSASGYKKVKRVLWDNLNGEKEKIGLKFGDWIPKLAHFYYQSKFFNVVFTLELQRRLIASGHKNITVNALHPGRLMPTSIYSTATPFFIKAAAFYLWVFGLSKTLEEGSWTTLTAAVDPKYGQEGGHFLYNCRPRPPTPFAQDKEVARKLWDVSVKLTGLNQ